MKLFFPVLSLILLTLIGCSEHANQNIENDIENLNDRLDALEIRNRYLEDYIAIWRVQSLYQHYINIGARQDIVNLFADDPNVEIELSNKGIVRGADAPRRYFLRQSRDAESGSDNSNQNNQERPAPIPGFMVLHMSVNPTIEIDQKGERAKAVWLSPGITNLYREGVMKAGWNFGKYEMDYLKQNGEWKILSFRWHQIFLTPYDKGWVEENLDPGSVGAPVPPDKPSAPNFYSPYSADKVNAFNPPPPLPFSD